MRRQELKTEHVRQRGDTVLKNLEYEETNVFFEQ